MLSIITWYEVNVIIERKWRHMVLLHFLTMVSVFTDVYRGVPRDHMNIIELGWWVPYCVYIYIITARQNGHFNNIKIFYENYIQLKQYSIESTAPDKSFRTLHDIVGERVLNFAIPLFVTSHFVLFFHVQNLWLEKGIANDCASRTLW